MNQEKLRKNIEKNKSLNLNEQKDEQILVIKRNILFSKHSFNGLKLLNNDEINYYLELIFQYKEFLPRNEMELDQNYKQIIPYLVFRNSNKYFLMQRRSKATEQRLKNMYSLGIGGHIRQEDISQKSIIDWAKREFNEEINYNDDYNVNLIGILNDDSNEVGKVHVGFVFLLDGNSDKISVKSELKSGNLLSLDDCKSYYSFMESWSQIIFDYLN